MPQVVHPQTTLPKTPHMQFIEEMVKPELSETERSSKERDRYTGTAQERYDALTKAERKKLGDYR